MDPSAIAETTVDMWVLIDAKLTARSQQTIDPEIKAMLLDKAMSLYMTHIINEKRGGAAPAAPQETVRPATDKQLAFIKDLGGDPGTVHSSVEASKLIEELKK